MMRQEMSRTALLREKLHSAFVEKGTEAVKNAR
jgi:hypothetical protein